MKSAAMPTSSPATSALATRPRASSVRSRISPSRDAAAASTSRCPPASSAQISRGLTDQSRCARARRAGSDRSSRSRPIATPRNAIPFHSFSQRMIPVAEVPPSLAAAHCSPVASGPYSDGYLCQVRCDKLPIGSPIWFSSAGVIT